ncbi:MAG: hypothetical protein EOM20_11055, partial [Spartobacteria bacterium]|nr:hypothetical protein [Spartobacteria bacterium]
KDEISFFQAVKARLAKFDSTGSGKTDEEKQLKRMEADGVVEKLRGGENFAKLAEKVSEEPRASRGGEWGWLNPADLNQAIATAIEELKPGEFTEAVEVGDALYIVTLEGRKEASMKPFEEVREEIQKELRIQEENRLYDAWIARLKDKYFIKIF